MKIKIIFLFLLLLSMSSLTLLISPYGIDSPEPIEAFLNNKFPKTSPSSGTWKTVDAFPGINFIDPIAMQQIPDDRGFYVAEKIGTIYNIKDENGSFSKTKVLDISELVIVSGDAGLINFILHPEFGQENSPNRDFIYLFYAYHPERETGEKERMNRLSRFSVDQNSLIIDPNSEFIIIQDYDPQGYHMGGGMDFDAEGFFYLSFGDGGEHSDIFNSSQQITERFWGGVIKIDLDNDLSRSHAPRREISEYPGRPADLPESFSQGYSIPNDNPFLDEGGAYLEEFYCLGLRSPHRIHFDNEQNRLIVGDVGQGAKEEVNSFQAGDNGQWPYLEANIPGPRGKPDSIIGRETVPLFAYNRSEGNSVIGGFIYRGDKWQSYLEGKYLFGDHETGNIWALNEQSGEVVIMTTIEDSGLRQGVSSFATDNLGNIYALKLAGYNNPYGKVLRFELEDQVVESIPEHLSETMAFSDIKNLIPASGVIPYAVNSPLWSDHAEKKRWIALANDGTHDSPKELISFYETGEWQFPMGTVFIKHFELPIDHRNPLVTKKIETRFYILDVEGRGYGLSYRWYEDESDAYLIDSGEKRYVDIVDEMGTPTTQIWEYPSRVQCNNCHNLNSGFVLGVNTAQLNSQYEYPSGIISNQLATWNHLGMFYQELDESKIKDLPQAVSLDHPEATLREKVVSYLASNCSNCHQPNGVEGTFDARFETTIPNKNLLYAKGVSHNNPAGGVMITPGSHEDSQIWIRDNSVQEDKMPPIGKSIVDEKWIAVLTEWIDGLEESCDGIFLSDLSWKIWAINGYGPPELDQSNGDYHKDDGNELSIGGISYRKGLGVHAYSELIYEINSEYKQFTSYIGIDDESCEEASLQFEVYTDGNLTYRSPYMVSGDAARFISIDVQDVDQLKLVVSTPRNNERCDHGDWAEAKLLKNYDSDGDGVCDNLDQCDGADDNIDRDRNGIPDGCEYIENGGEIAINISPNPFSNEFTIELEQPDFLTHKANLLISDLNGRIYFQDYNFLFDQPYTLGHLLTPGTYVIQAKAGTFRGVRTVIKLP